MLFDVTRGELVAAFGEDRLATLPTTAFPSAAADTEGARLLTAVGVPTGTLLPRPPDEGTGRLPLVRDVVPVGGAAGDWPVIGWLLAAHLALDPGSGTVYAVDADEATVRALHTDVSSLVHVTLRVERLLGEFTFGDDEEAGFERLEDEVGRIREETSGVDPLPFQDDGTVWSVVADEIAMGQRFRAGSPGGRSLYG
ncbi:SUKH-4 family immunity protein [Streptomyces niveiscabiei]|uniref:SUKH-4 family immunity protein n=1 Tax=Streptomyces niveiscabiei TaxID=164115 RepID=UPI0029BCB6DC|nr:SUKH-4 family immunity protein [Streptomyces niveiscabiei]MDX3384396.1 SUKH-4 family immunity protein [Streptomyces niveiscabiei]